MSRFRLAVVSSIVILSAQLLPAAESKPADKKAAPEKPGKKNPPQIPSVADDPVIARIGAFEMRRSELDGIYDRVDPESRKLWDQNGGKAAFLRDIAAKKRLILDAERKGLADLPDVKLDFSVARDTILYDRYVQKQIAPLLMPDDVLRVEYEKRKEDFKQPLLYHARHILVTPKKDEKIVNRNFDDAKSEEEAKTKIEFLQKRLKDGADFMTLATEYSEDPSASKGGDLGWFGRGVMVKDFEEALSKLSPGQVSGVVHSVFGDHIIRLEGRQDEGYIPFEKIADQLRMNLLSDRTGEVQKRTEETAFGLEKDYPLVVVDPSYRLN